MAFDKSQAFFLFHMKKYNGVQFRCRTVRFFCLRGCPRLRRELPACVVDGVGLGEDELADGHHGVAVVDETGEDGGQGLRRVQRGVVEQHDAALLHPAGHPLADGVRVVVLPVQGVPVGNDLKPLRCKGLLV